MSAPNGTPLQLRVAWEEARSIPSGLCTPGQYIGQINTEHGIFYFYKEGDKYWYKSEFDRQQEEKAAKRKRQVWKRRRGIGL